MNSKSRNVLAAAIAVTLAAIANEPTFADGLHNAQQHAVFVMTNDANANKVVAFERYGNGALREEHAYRTGGRGSGGTIDPLASQGSLTLSDDGRFLFAVNAGSGTVSVFRVDGSKLALVDETPTEGSEPNAVAQRGDLVYVLNTAGSSNVVGFRLRHGHLDRIDDSLRLLSGNGAGSASIAFSPSGKYLVVTERTTNNIDIFGVASNGTLSLVATNPSAVPGAFAATFAPKDRIIVSETGAGPNKSTVSSYSILANRAIAAITAGVATNGTANCWNAVTPDGRFVYVSNSGSSAIAGFAIADDGSLHALGAAVNNPAGSANLDIAISSDGAFLYSLNAAAGNVGVFSIDKQTGALRSLGTVGDLPAGAGLNGIAAN